MTGVRLDPAAAAVVATFTDRLDQLQRRTDNAKAAMVAATGSAVSEDGTVRVTVDANGALTDIAFGAGAEPDSTALTTLPTQIMATIRVAHQRALLRARDDVAAIVGGSSGAVAVLDRQAARLRAEDDVPATRPDFALDEEDPRGD